MFCRTQKGNIFSRSKINKYFFNFFSNLIFRTKIIIIKKRQRKIENSPLDVNLNKKEPAVWFKYKSFLEFWRDVMLTGWGIWNYPKIIIYSSFNYFHMGWWSHVCTGVAYRQIYLQVALHARQHACAYRQKIKWCTHTMSANRNRVTDRRMKIFKS